MARTKADLTTKLAGLDLVNPVLVASGTYGAGREGSHFVRLSDLGGVIVKSMTLTAWRGKPTPRMCETPSGMLNAIGIQNKGVDHFISEDLPWLLKPRCHRGCLDRGQYGRGVREGRRQASYR